MSRTVRKVRDWIYRAAEAAGKAAPRYQWNMTCRCAMCRIKKWGTSYHRTEEKRRVYMGEE